MTLEMTGTYSGLVIRLRINNKDVRTILSDHKGKLKRTYRTFDVFKPKEERC